MEYNQAVQTLKDELGTWYGDGQCYATTGYYIFLVSGVTISYSLGKPMMKLLGRGWNACDIATDWDFSAIGWTVDSPNKDKLVAGTIINIKAWADNVWFGYSEGHTAIVVDVDRETGNVGVIDSNYGVNSGGMGSATNYRTYKLDDVLTNIQSVIYPPNSQNEPTNDPTQSDLPINNGVVGAESGLNVSPVNIAVENVLNSLNKIIIDSINGFLEKTTSNVYSNKEFYYTNQILTLTRVHNTLKPKINDEAIKVLADEIKKSINDKILNFNIPSPSTSNTIKQYEDSKSETTVDSVAENTDEEKISLIVKICRKHCPTANVFGILGLIGNFFGESGCNPKTFEADYVQAHIRSPSKDVKPTAEDLYGSWNDFASLYPPNFLNQSVYFFEGQHWIGCGLGQWTGSRAKALYDYSISNSLDMWTVNCQMNFAFSELEGGNVSLLKQCLTNSNSIENGVMNVYSLWERASVPESIPKRLEYANKYYDLVKNILESL